MEDYNKKVFTSIYKKYMREEGPQLTAIAFYIYVCMYTCKENNHEVTIPIIGIIRNKLVDRVVASL